MPVYRYLSQPNNDPPPQRFYEAAIAAMFEYWEDFPSDSVHQIWAVINKGKPYQTERHTSAIIVGHAAVDCRSENVSMNASLKLSRAREQAVFVR